MASISQALFAMRAIPTRSDPLPLQPPQADQGIAKYLLRMTLSRQAWLHKRSTSSCLREARSLSLFLSLALARHHASSCSELKTMQWGDFQAMRLSKTFCEGLVAIGSTVFACCSANHSLAKQTSCTTQQWEELHEWVNGSQATFFMIQYTALHGR